jgi:hypothetical protein
MAAVGAIVGGVTGMIQGQYQASVANMNADIAKDNAKRAIERASINAEDQDYQTKALLGEQESQQAASGVTLSGKSQILTRESARKLGRRDSLNIIQAGSVEAYNYRTQAANFKAEAEAAKISGISSLIGGIAGAAGGMTSLVGGSSSTASPYKYIPQPLAKPTLLTSYLNPMLKPKWVPQNRGMY